RKEPSLSSTVPAQRPWPRQRARRGHTAGGATGEKAEGSSLPHVDGDASRLVQRHRCVHSAFTELRMTEHDFMRTKSLRHIAEGRFTDAHAVDEDLGPRNGIDAQGGSWQFDP